MEQLQGWEVGKVPEWSWHMTGLCERSRSLPSWCGRPRVKIVVCGRRGKLGAAAAAWGKSSG